MIRPEDIMICKKRLEGVGFEKQPAGEENHGQAFGLRYRLAEVLQLHFKVMPNGLIESEFEPPPEYPGAHLNQKHSYPPHEGLPFLLNNIGLKYTMCAPIPDTCNLPKIIKPDRPLSAWEMALVSASRSWGRLSLLPDLQEIIIMSKICRTEFFRLLCKFGQRF